MNSSASRIGIVRALVRKDLRHLRREPIALAMTLIGVLLYAGVYWLIPAESGGAVGVGVVQRGLDPVVDRVRSQVRASLRIVDFDSADLLKRAVEAQEREPVPLVGGAVFPDDFLERVESGRRATVLAYVAGTAHPAHRELFESHVRELAHMAAGDTPPVRALDEAEMVLGVDRSRALASMKERVRPTLGAFLLLFEILIIAVLVSAETRNGALAAVLATPARLLDVVAAKTLAGVSLALVQLLLLFALIGALGDETVIVCATAFLGALLVVGCGLVAGSQGRDLIGVIGWSLLFLLPLSVPVIGALLPGSASVLTMLLPTWALVETWSRVMLDGTGWADAWLPLVLLAGWGVVLLRVGIGSFRSMAAAR